MSQNGPTLATPQIGVNNNANMTGVDSKNIQNPIAESKNGNSTDGSFISSDSVSKSPKNDLEEGEIDADIPTTSTAVKKVSKIMDENSRKPPSPNIPTANISQDPVQKKLTALERLKSLNFAASKSEVNPFTLVTPKKSTLTTPAIKQSAQHSDSWKQECLPPPSKKQRIPVDSDQLFKGKDRQFRRHDRRNIPEKSINSVFIENRLPPHPDFRYHQHSQPSRNYDELDRPVEPEYSLPSTSTAAAIPEDGDQEEPTTSDSSIDWAKVRELAITSEEMDNLSLTDLRAVVQYLLGEETDLIQVHLRLQDQTKNVKRALDREKQIEQLKKQALAAAMASKAAGKETEEKSTSSKARHSKFSAVSEPRKQKHVRNESTSASAQSDGQNFEETLTGALKKSIDEQVAARKAHLRQYVESLGPNAIASGASTSAHQVHDQQSPTVTKERFTAMLKSYFDGVASMH